MLSKNEFEKKYKTKNKQRYEESFLETVSKEDRELYSDVEILTGRSTGAYNRNIVNKFYQNGYNLGKKYKTTRRKMNESFNKYMEGKLASGEITEIWDRVFRSSKKGDFNFTNMLLNRALGKEAEKIDLTIEDISFKIELDDNSKDRLNRNKEEENNS